MSEMGTPETGKVLSYSRIELLSRAFRAHLFNSSSRQWFLTLLDQAVVSATGFLTGVIVGRLCGKQEFGLFLLGQTIIWFVMEFQNVLILSPYTFYRSRFSGAPLELYSGSTLLHQLSMAGLGMLGLMVAGIVLTCFGGPQDLAPIIWMLAAVSVFILFREYCRRFCFAGLDIKSALAIDSGVFVLQLAGLAFLASVGLLSAWGAFGVIGMAGGLASVGWFLSVRRAFAFSRSQALADLRQNWSFGKWVLGDNLLEFASFHLYPWILAAYYGTQAVGVLAACQAIIALAKPFLQGSINFLAPNTARVYAESGFGALRRYVVKNTIIMALVMSLFCAVIAVWGDGIMTLIYGTQYGGHSVIITILALDILVLSCHLGVMYGIWAMGRPDINCKINLLLLGVTVTLGFWLVKDYGVVGVALGLLAGNLVALAVRFSIFFRRLA